MTHPLFLKRSLLFFWSIWLTVVLLSNLADAAKTAGILGESWIFASGNFRFVKETTARYGTSDQVNGLLFAGVIAWEAVAVFLFWRAWWRYRGKSSNRRNLYNAFASSLSLWGAFMIADEICITYAVEATHLRLFVAHLVTLLAIELLPDE